MEHFLVSIQTQREKLLLDTETLWNNEVGERKSNLNEIVSSFESSLKSGSLDYKLPLSTISLTKGTLNIGYNIQVASRQGKQGGDATAMTTPRPMIERIRAYATSTKKPQVHLRNENIENQINFTPYKAAELAKLDSAQNQSKPRSELSAPSLGRVDEPPKASAKSARSQTKRVPLAEIKPATPISKRVRQRARAHPNAQPSQENKGSLLHFAENLRSKLINQNVKPRDESANRPNEPTQSQPDAALDIVVGDDSMEVKQQQPIESKPAKPKLKLLFDDDAGLSTVFEPKEEVEQMEIESAAMPANEPTSPKRKLPSVLAATEMASEGQEERFTKKRKSTTEFGLPDDETSSHDTRKDSLMSMDEETQKTKEQRLAEVKLRAQEIRKIQREKRDKEREERRLEEQRKSSLISSTRLSTTVATVNAPNMLPLSTLTTHSLNSNNYVPQTSISLPTPVSTVPSTDSTQLNSTPKPTTATATSAPNSATMIKPTTLPAPRIEPPKLVKPPNAFAVKPTPLSQPINNSNSNSNNNSSGNSNNSNHKVSSTGQPATFKAPPTKPSATSLSMAAPTKPSSNGALPASRPAPHPPVNNNKKPSVFSSATTTKPLIKPLAKPLLPASNTISTAVLIKHVSTNPTSNLHKNKPLANGRNAMDVERPKTAPNSSNNSSHSSLQSQLSENNSAHSSLSGNNNSQSVRAATNNNNSGKPQNNANPRSTENSAKPVAKVGDVSDAISSHSTSMSTSDAFAKSSASTGGAFADFEGDEFVVESYDSDLDLPSESYDDAGLVTAELDYLLIGMEDKAKSANNNNNNISSSDIGICKEMIAKELDKFRMPPPSTPSDKSVHKQIKSPKQRFSLNSPNLNRTPSTPSRSSVISPMSICDGSFGSSSGPGLALPTYDPNCTYESSSSEDDDKIKRMPSWCRPENLDKQLRKQATVDPALIFFSPPKMCNLENVFGRKRVHYSRTTRESGRWSRDRMTSKEKEDYKKVMGYVYDSTNEAK